MPSRPPGVVLVTGVGRYLGGRVAARLSGESSIERIIGIDTVAPRPGALGRTEFVRADVRHRLIAKVLDQARVDTVVHLRDGDPGSAASLLDACEQSATVTRVVAESTTAVYGAAATAPAVLTEQAETKGPADAHEAPLRAFARRRPDVAVTILRLADLIGPAIDTWLTRYLGGPIVPTAFGYDPRLQLLHEDDAVEVVSRTCLERHPGIINVAGPGVITLAQAARRAGRLRLPVPARALAAVTSHTDLLRFGRVVDTTRLVTRVGYRPRYTSVEALHSYLDARAAWPRAQAPALTLLAALQERVLT